MWYRKYRQLVFLYGVPGSHSQPLSSKKDITVTQIYIVFSKLPKFWFLYTATQCGKVGTLVSFWKYFVKPIYNKISNSLKLISWIFCQNFHDLHTVQKGDKFDIFLGTKFYVNPIFMLSFRNFFEISLKIKISFFIVQFFSLTMKSRGGPWINGFSFALLPWELFNPRGRSICLGSSAFATTLRST